MRIKAEVNSFFAMFALPATFVIISLVSFSIMPFDTQGATPPVLPQGGERRRSDE
jgi:hypothetical protein